MLLVEWKGTIGNSVSQEGVIGSYLGYLAHSAVNGPF